MYHESIESLDFVFFHLPPMHAIQLLISINVLPSLTNPVLEFEIANFHHRLTAKRDARTRKAGEIWGEIFIKFSEFSLHKTLHKSKAIRLNQCAFRADAIIPIDLFVNCTRFIDATS
jgi:hypothetical protein